MINGTHFGRREVMIRLVRAFDEGNFAEALDQIPIQMRPKGQTSTRCCTYLDRAILKYRVMSLLGVACEDETDEAKTLASYYNELFVENNGEDCKKEHNPLSVCSTACSGCPPSRIVVTGSCRGCFARPCFYNCPTHAISIVDQVSTIDYSKCIKCGKCISACPFHAIIKTTVPCEEACPVGAIHKDDKGTTTIDFDKCIFCGKCFNACPFSAILERSQLVQVLHAIKRGEKVVAMVAPAVADQFPGTIEQLFAAILKTGFSDVMEVALGAELTTQHETAEFEERIAADPKTLMTTSCCPAYVELVRKHLPGFLPNVSTTPSPMIYSRDLVREQYPDAKVAFIGPCVAKRVEAERNGVDFVLSFEELGAIIAGRRIDIMSCEPKKVERPAIASARNFAHSCGVTKAVLEEAAAKAGHDVKISSDFINGLDKRSIARLKMYAMGKMPANFLEVMACEGGCVSGPSSLKKL